MNYLFKITLSGIRGRKRDTWLFASIILLATLFIISTSVFNTSVTASKRAEQQKRFGNWEVATFNRPSEDIDTLLKDPRIKQYALSDIIGTSSNLGLVGTLGENWASLSHLQLDSGHLPQNDDEIALEASLNNQLIAPYKVGDKILVKITIPIIERVQDDVFFRQYNAAKARLDILAGEILEAPSDPQHQVVLQKLQLTPKEISNLSQRELTDRLIAIAGTPITRIDSIDEKHGDVEVLVSSAYTMIETNFKNTIVPLSQEALFAHQRQDGTFANQYTTLTKTMTVSAIITPYSEDWDTGIARVPSVFISDSMGEQFKEAFTQSQLMVENNVSFKKSILVRLSPMSAADSSGQMTNIKNLISDYGKSTHLIVNANGLETVTTESDSVMTFSIIGMVLIFTLAASFQLNLIQLKKRARKMALLRAIGATYGQLLFMLITEMLIVISLCLPIGTLLAMGLVKLALVQLSSLWHFTLLFIVDWQLVLASLIFTALAVILGMLIPLIMALNLPLTGNVSKPPRHRQGKSSTHKQNHQVNNQVNNLQTHDFALTRPLTFFRLSTSHFFYEHKKNILTASLYTLSLSCLLLSGLLSYWAFDSYREAVIIPDKPSYVIEYRSGLARRNLPEYEKQLAAIEGVKRQEIVKGGEFSFLWHKKLVKHPIFAAFKNTLTTAENKEHFATQYNFFQVKRENQYIINEGIVINPFGIDSKSSMMAHLLGNIDSGQVDLKEFDAGEEVILLLPSYKPLKNAEFAANAYNSNDVFNRVPKLKKLPADIHQRNRMAYKLKLANAYQLSYKVSASGKFSTDYGVAVGDTIEIATPVLKFKSSVDANEVIFKKVKVAAIINDFKPVGLWPITHHTEGPVVIMSRIGLGKLYPNNIASSTYNSAAYLNNTKPYQPDIEGKTWIHIHTTTFANHPKILSVLKDFANETNGKVVNLNHTNSLHFARCLKIAAVLTLLGTSIAIFALMILYNMTLSKVSSEQGRIGVLQALGVTTLQFKRQYRLTALLFALFALMLAHLLLLVVTLIVTAAQGVSPTDYLLNSLWQYPWEIHGLLCLIYMGLAFFSYYLPILRIVKHQPCVNINAL